MEKLPVAARMEARSMSGRSELDRGHRLSSRDLLMADYGKKKESDRSRCF